MQKFIKKFKGKTIEDWGTTCSDEFKSFTRCFKNALKREFPNAKLYGFEPNHYDFSGFIEEDGKFIYVSYSMLRGVPFDPYCGRGNIDHLLVRTAKNEKDYHGGYNNFCDFYNLHTMVDRLFVCQG